MTWIHNDFEIIEEKNNKRKSGYITHSHEDKRVDVNIKTNKQKQIISRITYDTYTKGDLRHNSANNIEYWMSIRARAINVYRTPLQNKRTMINS